MFKNYLLLALRQLRVAAGAGMLLITLATVSFQAFKAALMSPVRSLRTE